MGRDSQRAKKLRAAPAGTGPYVLIVRVEVTVAPPAGTMTGCELNEQMGGIVTRGVIEEHASVTPPAGLE